MQRDEELREILSRAPKPKDTGAVVFNGPVTIIVNGGGVAIAASGTAPGYLERRRTVLAAMPAADFSNQEE